MISRLSYAHIIFIQLNIDQTYYSQLMPQNLMLHFLRSGTCTKKSNIHSRIKAIVVASALNNIIVVKKKFQQ